MKHFFVELNLSAFKNANVKNNKNLVFTRSDTFNELGIGAKIKNTMVEITS
jgi:hypothetical protein